MTRIEAETLTSENNDVLPLTPFSANYHSHTFRCGHATGTDEEYAKAAFDAGFKVLGFSDHLMGPGLHQQGIRGEEILLPGYIESVRKLKKKYKGKMTIYLGMEAEWLGKEWIPYYQKLRKEMKMDYLILGQHAFMEFGKFYWYSEYGDPSYGAEAYLYDLIEGMDSGLFDCVAHPDLFFNWYPHWDDYAETIARKIAEAAARNHLPLEVNMGQKNYRPGIDIESCERSHYPFPRFWDIISEYPVDVIIGVDAHSPLAYERAAYDAFVAFCKNHNLHRLERLKGLEG